MAGSEGPSIVYFRLVCIGFFNVVIVAGVIKVCAYEELYQIVKIIQGLLGEREEGRR